MKKRFKVSAALTFFLLNSFIFSTSTTSASDFEGLFALGPSVPIGDFANTNGRGFNFSWTNGNRFGPYFSLLGEAEYHLFPAVGSSYLFTDSFAIIQLVLVGKIRLIDAGFTPYLIGGPGMTFNVNMGGSTGSLNPSFLWEAGAGLELTLDSGTALYVQGKYCANYVPTSLYPTTPLTYIPLQAGIVYFYH
jgi:hypothetical protein